MVVWMERMGWIWEEWESCLVERRGHLVSVSTIQQHESDPAGVVIV